MLMHRVILLADMNSFFVSCHQAVRPELKDKKVIVAGDPGKRRGIVLAASYPAKAAGIKTGMPLWEARELCPDAYFLKPDYDLYMDFSCRILRIIRDFTDLVEPFSVDEAFADLTGVTRLWGPPGEIARVLKGRIHKEAGVLCSVGLGPNKLIAKMAAGLQKPNGLTILDSAEDFKRIFWPQPVRKLFGVGPRYEKHLRQCNVRTIGELANFPVRVLKRKWGKNGEMLWLCANGIDYSPVVPFALDVSKSIGQQKTLPRDLRGLQSIKVVLLELSEMVARRARQGGYAGRTVALTLRDPQLRFFCRCQSRREYTDLPEEIYRTACAILYEHWRDTWPVRLVGVTLSNLVRRDYFQGDVFGERMRLSRLARACDAVKDRFGEQAVLRGVSLLEESISHG